MVAYYVGLPTSATTQAGGPDELQLVPRNATLVAYASVQDIMVSELRQRLLGLLPLHGDGQQEFQDQTGIDIETDIDSVIAVVVPPADPARDGGPRSSGLVLARGRFDEERIEALMRERGAAVEDYMGTRLIVGDNRFAVAFPKTGLAALGSTPVVRQAIELKDAGDSVLINDDVMNLVRSMESGNAWAVGRFDSLTAQARLPQDLEVRLPSITWFTANAHINGGIRGVLRAEATDEEAATSVRDVVRGFLAFAKLQTTSRPELQTLLQAVELGGTGTSVALSFDLPSALLDVLFQAREQTPQ
jgi:hypothetical protein